MRHDGHNAFLRLLLAPFLFLFKLMTGAMLWGAWLILAVATLASLSAGVVLCIGGYLLIGLIVIGLTVIIEWGLF